MQSFFQSVRKWCYVLLTKHYRCIIENIGDYNSLYKIENIGDYNT